LRNPIRFLNPQVALAHGAVCLFISALILSPVQAVTLAPGDLVVGESRSPVLISVVNVQTGGKTVICSCTTLQTIRDVAVKGSEKIYAVGQLPNASYAVVAVDPATGAQTVVSSGGVFNSPTGIAVESSGSILVSDNSSTSPLAGSVIRVNPSNGQQTVISSGNRMTQTRGLTVGSTGQILVAATISFPAGQLPLNKIQASGVLAIDSLNGEQTVVAYGDQFELTAASWTEMANASDVALDKDGVIYVLDKRYRGSTLEDETRLIKIDPVTGAQTLLTSGLKGVDRTKSGFDFRGIAASNGVIYAPDYRLSETGLPGISKFDPAVGIRQGVTVSSTDFYNPTGLDLVSAAAVTTTSTTATTSTSTTITSVATTTSTTVANSVPVAVIQGWNLLGNGSDTPIDVPAIFSDDTRFTTVWKWIAAQSAWAIHAPSLAAQGGAALSDYVTSKGYQLLTTIAGGEGYWVNAKQTGSVNLYRGNTISAASLASKLTAGWNLVSIGETATPKQFCDAQTGGVTTLWAWDATNSAWYFYAPGLVANGGLNAYVSNKGYLEFTTVNKTLGPGVGFWVNKP